MDLRAISSLCALHIYEGLREGLSLFSGPSRVALLYCPRKHSRMRIFDPQNLLEGHEPKLWELYLDSEEWRMESTEKEYSPLSIYPVPLPDLGLAGLISKGGRSGSMFYQRWFTEHHPDMCSVGPTIRWLEHAVWLLSHDVGSETACYIGTSGYVLREYATHAVRDYIVDQLNMTMGMDMHMRIYPILDAVLKISKTAEEGAWPLGEMLFVEKGFLPDIHFLVRFPEYERPNLDNEKHVRKILQAVEGSDRKLISEGRYIIGIAKGPFPEYHLLADFRAGHGFLWLSGEKVCSFFDGTYQSTTRRAKLVQLEEILIDHGIAFPPGEPGLFQIISTIVHHAEDSKCGCTLVIDLNETPLEIAGQTLDEPLDLQDPTLLDLTCALSLLDGALHITGKRSLEAFACILDGRFVRGEDRARGARFNSALRFTAVHKNIVVIVVSADRPVSIIQEGVELNAQCQLKPVSACLPSPPRLSRWIEGRT